MSRSTFKILFYVNKGKEKDGIVPVMGRITINNVSKDNNDNREYQGSRSRG